MYEFHAVSMFWALTSIEMALKLKFMDKCPDPITVIRKAGDGTQESIQVAANELQDYRRLKVAVLRHEGFRL